MMISPVYQTIEDFADDVHRALQGELTFEENISCVRVEYSDTGSADTEFTVTHGLGRLPRHYVYNIDKAGIVYDSRRSSWTDTIMYLKCNAANASLTLTIL